MKVKSESEVARSCLTLSDPVDCSPPGSSVHGIFQARVLEWGAIAFSTGHFLVEAIFNLTLHLKQLEKEEMKNSRVSRWRRQWHPTPVLLPGKSHGQRSLVGCSPWGREESDTTERLHFDFSLSCIGEGNGNPLQYSCLKNHRDGGEWWAAVYGVTQSRKQLK